MLALSRKKGESIIISDDIEIVVVGIQNDQVKLGIIAPKTISIHRKEIYQQIIEENKDAVFSAEKTTLKDVSDILAQFRKT